MSVGVRVRRLGRSLAAMSVVASLLPFGATPAEALESVETKLVASDGAAEDHFGFRVAVSGDRSVVGAWRDDDNGTSSGSAYVFEPDAAGGWVETKLVASDAAEDDRFGFAVAVSVDRVVVGAHGDDDNGTGSGSAYVFESDGAGGWVETKLVPSDGAEDDRFGGSVAVSFDRIVVGAPSADDNGTNSGSIYVFEPDGAGGWVETKLVASDGVAGDEFGLVAAMSGDRIVVGAPFSDENGNLSGSVYVFEPDGAGGWVETKLVPSDGAAEDRFGQSLVVSDNRIVVGAPFSDENGNLSGSVYVFEPDGAGGWVETKLVASDGAAEDRFGSSVGVSGDRVVVGAHFDGDNGTESGSAYVFESDGAGGWVETKLVPSDGAAGDRFGISAAMLGDRLLVGAYLDDDNGTDSGSAYVFELSSSETPNSPPVAAAGGPYLVDEGSSVQLDGSGSFDSDGTITSYDWSPGDDLDDQSLVDPTFTGVDDAVLDMTLTVTDDDGDSDSDSTTVTVSNVVPTVEAGADQTATVGDTVSLDPATFVDPGTVDTHTAEIDWGDGTVEAGTVDQAAGTVSGSHSYATDGVFTVTVTVTDDDGGVGSDTILIQFTDIETIPWHLDRIDAPEAWETTTGDPSIVVAVISTGIDLDHPEFSGRLVPGTDIVDNDGIPEDEDPDGFGTKLAGLVGAANDSYPTGVAPGVSIMPIRVYETKTLGFLADVGEGVSWAVDHGADVILIGHHSEHRSFSLEDAIREALDAGVPVICPAGDSDGFGGNEMLFPARTSECISVTGTDDNDRLLSGSRFGPGLEMSAPGAVLLTTTVGGGDGNLNSTAGSAAQVAGAAALLASLGADIDQITESLLQSAEDLGFEGYDQFSGYGLLNVRSALDYYLSLNSEPEAENDTAGTVVGVAVDIDVIANDSDPDGDSLTVTNLSDPANGAVTVNPDGTVRYTPDPGFSGVDTFTYTAFDGQAESDPATVTVNVEDVTPPVLELPADMTVEAASPDGAKVGFTVTATDDSDPAPNVTCIPESGSLFPLGETLVTCTATDASGNSSEGGFLVTVEVGESTFDGFIADVKALELQMGMQRSIVSKIEEAQDLFASEDIEGAITKLMDVINFADAQEGKRLTTEEADQIRAWAQTLIDALNS